MTFPITINPARLELDETYMQMAEIWGNRSKANRQRVGALIVKNSRIISDGYNGMPSGWHDDVCEEWIDGGPSEDPQGIFTGLINRMVTKPELLHAESNALLKLASAGGEGAEGATLYTTLSPCPQCAKLIRQAKIARVVYRDAYRILDGIEMLKLLKVPTEQLRRPEVK